MYGIRNPITNKTNAKTFAISLEVMTDFTVSLI